MNYKTTFILLAITILLTSATCSPVFVVNKVKLNGSYFTTAQDDTFHRLYYSSFGKLDAMVRSKYVHIMHGPIYLEVSVTVKNNHDFPVYINTGNPTIRTENFEVSKECIGVDYSRIYDTTAVREIDIPPGVTVDFLYRYRCMYQVNYNKFMDTVEHYAAYFNIGGVKVKDNEINVGEFELLPLLEANKLH